MTVVAEEAADDEDAAPAVSCAAAVVVISSLIARQVRRMSSSSSLYVLDMVCRSLLNFLGWSDSEPSAARPFGCLPGAGFPGKKSLADRSSIEFHPTNLNC